MPLSDSVWGVLAYLSYLYEPRRAASTVQVDGLGRGGLKGQDTHTQRYFGTALRMKISTLAGDFGHHQQITTQRHTLEVPVIIHAV